MAQQAISHPAVQSQVSASPNTTNPSITSISSDGSIENQSPSMEQEDIAVLTHDVRNFKEALGKLRRTLNPDQEKMQPQRVVAHERLGEVLRILRSVLEKYPALQSSELLLSASTLIQHLKGYGFEDSGADPKQFFELIDQLALAFSSRVSEYLMGDLDTNMLLTNLASSKTKSCENLAEEGLEGLASSDTQDDKKGDLSEKLDVALLNLEQGVEFALNRAKVWAKYAKDIMMYIEKRCHLEMEYTRNLNKLAQTVRPLINEESNLPFQSIYCTALDYDMENSNSSQATCSLLLGNKFLEPLSERRTEHEKERRQLKEQWFREIARMHDLVLRMRRSHSLYIQRQHETDNRPADEDAIQKAMEAEAAYKVSVSEANEGHKKLYIVKNEILQKIRILLAESDNILRTVTVAYFQLQHTLTTPSPVQFQTLCESSRLYEPGSQYLEAVKRLAPPAAAIMKKPFAFEKYPQGAKRLIEQERKSTDSIEGEDLLFQGLRDPALGSDTDSVASAASSHDADTSPSASCRSPSRELISELDSGNDNGVGYMSFHQSHRHSLSKAAETHSFRKLKTPSRCRECDSYVYFQGVDCSECGLSCHKKCLETLAIQCGHKRLPRKMTTFGVDLAQHLGETSTLVPHIVCKCIDEIDSRGRLIMGIYRVSGVKSKVEKLCQAFENGAELVDLTDIHPNVIANVLKLYLRQLPEPLLTFRLYPDFIRIAKECPSNSPSEMKIACEELKELVKKLSRQHYLTLAILMLHLKRVSNDSDVNNMPPSNLGIVFGPTLLRTAEGSASLSSLIDTVHQTRAIELLIMHSEELFNSQEVAVAREHSLKMIKANENSNLGRSCSFIDRSRKPKDLETAASCLMVDETDFPHVPFNTSDDETSYFLSMDGPTRSKRSPQLSHTGPTPKIFKGSLKDYQGLEGVSLSSLGMRSLDDGESSHQKLRKSMSDTSSKERTCEIETISVNRRLVVSKKLDNEKLNVVMSSAEEWYDSNASKHSPKTGEMSKNKHIGQRTESSADSDYSLESHASSAESRSPRELDESSEVFLELPAPWTKKSNPSGNSCDARHKLGSGDSPSSSLSHSLDESQGSDVIDELDHTVRKTVAQTHSATCRTHVSTATKLDQGENIYIPLFQKHCQESSQVCSSKQSTYHCKGINSSNVEKQDIVALKTQFLGFQDEEMNAKKSQQKLASSVATMKMSTAQQIGHCTQTKTTVFGTAEKSKQLVLSHKEDTSVQMKEVVSDSSQDIDDLLDT